MARAVANDQGDLEALLDRAAQHGTPGLVMRRAAALYPGEARTDRRDARVIADTGRTRRRQVRAAGRGRIERAVKARSPRIAGKVTTAVMTTLAAQDVTVPAKTVTGRVIAELASELDRVCGRRDSLAAFASLRDPASKTFYDRKRAEGKRHKATLICLARRRCDVILAMLTTGTACQADRRRPEASPQPAA